MFHVPEIYRLKGGQMGTTEVLGNNGIFIVTRPKFTTLLTQASDGGGWEHVSVSTPVRCPTWAQMCFIKHLFWDDEDFVVQMHPPKSEWVNFHKYCLHLWRKAGTNDFCERPPSFFVGPMSK